MAGRSATVGPLLMPDANDCEAEVAILGEGVSVSDYVEPVTFTSDGVTAASATASMTLTAEQTPAIAVEVGQVLFFDDGSANSYIAVVRTRYPTTSGGTTLELITLEAIPDAATAQFPPKAKLLTDLSSALSVTTSSTSTFDHDAGGERATGDSEENITASGFYSYYNAGGKSIDTAARTKAPVYVAILEPNPDANAFASGEKLWGQGVISSANSSRSQGGKIGFDFQVDINGVLTRTAPTTV
ncbi:MAG: hypothetical protein AAF810_04935 [Cyanobacteria bacterium P01_D01_bin.36]